MGGRSLENNEKTMNSGQGVIGNLTVALNIVVAISMFGLMAVTFADVLGRYLFSSPVPGSVDIIQMIMGVLIFSALPLVSLRQEHITVDLLQGIFTRRGEWIRDIIVAVISAGVLGFISVRMFDSASAMWADNQLGFFLDVPIAPVVYFMSALSALALVLMLLLARKMMRSGPDTNASQSAGDDK